MEINEFWELHKEPEQQMRIFNDYKDYSKNGYSFEDYLAEYQECEMCGDWFLTDDMVDTEGMIGGGIGYVCLTCKGDM